MNASTSFRLLCIAAAFGITAFIFSAVISLANVTTDTGSTTLMSLSHPSPASAPMQLIALAE